jgi:SAM-dependent methyltransferase
MMRGRDPRYLAREQYHSGAKLRARIAVHERFATNPVGLPRWLFDQLKLAPDARLLEVGCGNGELWAKNTDRIPSSWRLTLTDLSPGMLREARARLRDLVPPPKFRRADVQGLPFPARSFDAVLANYILFHVPDLDGAIRNLARVLAPGGRLYAATNGRGHMRELQEMEGIFGELHDEAHHSFTCENGSSVLRAHFGRVRFLRYPDTLEITEPKAAVAYVLSVIPSEFATRARVAALREEVDRRIRRGGGTLRVSKNTGLFVASDPRP